MIIVTGGAGFIGSAFVAKLNQEGVTDILIVDELGSSDKWRNLVGLSYSDFLHKDEFRRRFLEGRLYDSLDAVVHMGACSSTTETNADYLMENNTRYTRDLADWCLRNRTRFVYASSAATYGDGAAGYDDDEAGFAPLRPLNMYGYSKLIFDLWARRSGASKTICGLKFFNVYGPNEYHKGDMRSVVHKAFEQVRDRGSIRLFKSYRPEMADGEQQRDFIYVKDCLAAMWWLVQHPEVNGVFNLGTGKARSWNDLARAVFSAMGREPRIEYIEMPEAIRDRYQYFTCARMQKLAATGCPVAVTSLEDGVRDYISYLRRDHPYMP